MELKDIIAISGQPGLFRYLAQSPTGLIVESLADKKRMNVSKNSRVSSLAEIAIYTESEDMPLAKVFETIFEHQKGEKAISHKESEATIRDFIASVLPDYDRDRVHLSDMKKIVAWYNILIDNGFTEFKLPE